MLSIRQLPYMCAEWYSKLAEAPAGSNHVPASVQMSAQAQYVLYCVLAIQRMVLCYESDLRQDSIARSPRIETQNVNRSFTWPKKSDQQLE